MKKIILFSIFILTSLSIIAQTSAPVITLRENGFTGTDSTKNFVVLDFPKDLKGDLYKKSLTYFNGIYKNPSKVISTVDGESITINGFDDHLSQAGGLYRYPFGYNIVVQFKDGKIRFEPRILDMKEVFTVNNKETPFYVNGKNSPDPNTIHCIYIYNNEKDYVFLFQTDLKIALDKWINNYLAGFSGALADNW